MEYAQIPNIDKNACRIALGTWSIGGVMWGGLDESKAMATIVKAMEKGVNLIDTAPIYGYGLSEEMVGKALKQYGNRENFIIATKVGIRWEKDKFFRDSSRKRILKEFDDSLKRLQVDYIDLYQVHWPDYETPFEETAKTMSELFKSGKIRAIGVCNYSPDEMSEFEKYAPLHSTQPPFNLFEREQEKTTIDYALKKKLAILGYGPLCRGLLSGRMTKETMFKGDDIRNKDPKFKEPLYSDYLKCVESLQEWVQRKYHRSLVALAIRWVLDKGITFPLWGARKPEQLDLLDQVWGWKLNEEDFSEIDKILKVTLKHEVGPEFMAPPKHAKAISQ